MNDYLKSIQDDYRLEKIRILFHECKKHYLKSAELVGKYNEYIKYLKEKERFYTDGPLRIMKAIEDRYNKEYCDVQMQIFEPFEKMTDRRWHSFIWNTGQALIMDNSFCRSFLRSAGFLDQNDIELAIPTALQIIKDLELRWYVSDEPKREDNEN